MANENEEKSASGGNKNLLIALGVLILIALGVFLYVNNSSTETMQEDQSMQSEEVMEDTMETASPSSEDSQMMENDEVMGEMSEGNTVVYTDSGYEPESLAIKAGTTVTFVNESSEPMWTATAVHPSHTVYPNSNIMNCETDQADQMFDSCEAVEPGGSYSFTFEEVGTWKYHNHLNATQTGEIVVE